MEEELLKKIEELNLENINIKTSKEYKIGSDYLKFKKMLKGFQLKTFFYKLIARKKVNNLNLHGELENNFKYDNTLKSNRKPKIVVYTCIVGNYEKLIEPFLKFDNIDYVAFLDNQEKSAVWNIKEIPSKIKKLENATIINRYIKFHPYEIFSKDNYDYAIYIDGNIKVMSNLTNFVYAVNSKTGLALHHHRFRNCIYKEIEVCRLIKKGNYKNMKIQKDRYKNEGFPIEFGLYECPVIVSDLKNKNAKNILNSWWDEFVNSESFRDQISLPYIIWKNGYKFDDVGSLGDNIYKNPKLRLYVH